VWLWGREKRKGGKLFPPMDGAPIENEGEKF